MRKLSLKQVYIEKAHSGATAEQPIYQKILIIQVVVKHTRVYTQGKTNGCSVIHSNNSRKYFVIQTGIKAYRHSICLIVQYAKRSFLTRVVLKGTSLYTKEKRLIIVPYVRKRFQVKVLLTYTCLATRKKNHIDVRCVKRSLLTLVILNYICLFTLESNCIAVRYA